MILIFYELWHSVPWLLTDFEITTVNLWKLFYYDGKCFSYKETLELNPKMKLF